MRKRINSYLSVEDIIETGFRSPRNVWFLYRVYKAHLRESVCQFMVYLGVWWLPSLPGGFISICVPPNPCSM